MWAVLTLQVADGVILGPLVALYYRCAEDTTNNCQFKAIGVLGVCQNFLEFLDILPLLYSLVRMTQNNFLKKNPNIFYLSLTFFALVFHLACSMTWSVYLVVSDWETTVKSLFAAIATYFSLAICQLVFLCLIFSTIRKCKTQSNLMSK